MAMSGLSASEVAKFRTAWRSFVAIGGVRRMAQYIAADIAEHGPMVVGVTEPGGRWQLPPRAADDYGERDRIAREVDLRAAAKLALYVEGFFADPTERRWQWAEIAGDDIVLACYSLTS